MKSIFQFLFLIFLFPVGVFAQWTQLTSGTTQVLNELIFPATDTGYVVGDEGTLLRTTDGGTNWTQLNISTTKNLNDIYFLDSQTGYVVGDSGFFASTVDGGSSWNSTYLNASGELNLNSVFFTSVLTGYAGGSVNFTQGIILKTTDGGINWTVTNTPVGSLDINYKRIVFPDPNIGYALSRGMCIKTIDAGSNWFVTDTNLVNSGGMFSILEDAYFFSADTGYIVGWYNPFSGYTVNGGTTWIDQLVLNNQWYSIDFSSPQTGYMIGWSQLVKTTDGGQTWWDITSPLIQLGGIYSMDFTDDNTGYACGENGRILKTTNGGITGIESLDFENKLSVYPNPSNGLVNIKIDKVIFSENESSQVQLLDICGKVVFEHVLRENESRLEVQLNKGMYFVKIENNGNTYMEKLVIQ